MPSQTSTIGPLTLPVPAGSPGAAFLAPVVDEWLPWCGFWLKTMLDAKLATITTTGGDALPDDEYHRFAFDPDDKRASKVTRKPPCLFVWADENSTHVQRTMLYKHRLRTIYALYIFGEYPKESDMNERRGLMDAADAAFHMAADRTYHPSYAPTGWPAGSPITQALGGEQVFGWELTRVQRGRSGIKADGQNDVTSPKGLIGRDYPAIKAEFLIEERIGLPTLITPDDVMGDSSLGMRTADEGQTPETLIERYHPGPDS